LDAVIIKMWRLKTLHHKASGSASDLEEFKRKRREFEKGVYVWPLYYFNPVMLILYALMFAT